MPFILCSTMILLILSLGDTALYGDEQPHSQFMKIIDSRMNFLLAKISALERRMNELNQASNAQLTSPCSGTIGCDRCGRRMDKPAAAITLSSGAKQNVCAVCAETLKVSSLKVLSCFS